jgi:hypothetical protein
MTKIRNPFFTIKDLKVIFYQIKYKDGSIEKKPFYTLDFII